MTEQIAISNKDLQTFHDAIAFTQKVCPDLQVKDHQDDTLPFEGSDLTTIIWLEFKYARALFYLGYAFHKNLQAK